MEVTNNIEKHRFEVRYEGIIAFMDYSVKFKRLIIAHTQVPVEFVGQGIGKMLVNYAIKYAEEHKLLIIAICSFTEAYLNKHPEFNHLRDMKK